MIMVKIMKDRKEEDEERKKKNIMKDRKEEDEEREDYGLLLDTIHLHNPTKGYE